MRLEGLTLSERRHRKTETARPRGHMQHETVPLTEAASGTMVAGAAGAEMMRCWSKVQTRGSWGVPSVQHRMLNFGSGRNLRVVGSRPTLGSELRMESA